MDEDITLSLYDGQADSEMFGGGPQTTCPARESYVSNPDTRISYVRSKLSIDNTFELHSTPANEAVPRCRLSAHYDDDDDVSIIQAFPSSAWIWGEADQFGDEVHDSGLDLATTTLKMVYEHSRPDRHFSGTHLLQSPFPSTPVLTTPSQPPRDPLCLFSPKPQPAFDFPLLPVELLQEKITISLLEAMDNRDRETTVFWVDNKSCRLKKPLSAFSPRPVPTTARRIWKILRFW